MLVLGQGLCCPKCIIELRQDLIQIPDMSGIGKLLCLRSHLEDKTSGHVWFSETIVPAAAILNLSTIPDS